MAVIPGTSNWFDSSGAYNPGLFGGVGSSMLNPAATPAKGSSWVPPADAPASGPQNLAGLMPSGGGAALGYQPVNMSRGYNVDSYGNPLISYSQSVLDQWNTRLNPNFKYQVGPTPTSAPSLVYSGPGELPSYGFNGSGAYVMKAGQQRPSDAILPQGFKFPESGGGWAGGDPGYALPKDPFGLSQPPGSVAHLTPGGMPSGAGAGASTAGQLQQFMQSLLQYFGGGGSAGPAPTTTTTTTQPGATSDSTAPASPGFPNAADNQLASNSGLIGYLENLVKNSGYATNTQPAWQSMVDAMTRNNQKRFADLQEGFGVSGNRFGSAFGSASTDFWNQAGLDQNSLLAQMGLAAQEAARGRELSGANTLAGIGQQGLSQLSSQDFQAEMQRMLQGYQAASQLFGGGSQAASQLSSQGMQGALQLLQNATGATQGLFNTENQAALAEVARQLQLQGMSLSGGDILSKLWQSNLGLGGQLGGQQYATGQDQINRLYQEFLRTQPEYSSLLPYLSQGASSYPNLFYPQFQPSQLGNIMGGAGNILGALPGLLKLFGIGTD